MDFKITDEGGVIGEFNLWYAKIGDLDVRTVENIVQLPPGRPTGMRGLPLTVCASQTRCGEKQLQFPITPEHIEVAGNHHRSFYISDHLMKFMELVMTMAEFQREVYKKDVKILQLQLDYQTFNAFTEVMKPVGDNLLAGQYSITLLVDHRHLLCQGTAGILRLVDVILLYFTCNGFSLVALFGPIGPTVHLEEADDIRLDLSYEINNLVEISVGALEIAAVRNWKVKTFAHSCTVADIIQKQSHIPSILC